MNALHPNSESAEQLLLFPAAWDEEVETPAVTVAIPVLTTPATPPATKTARAARASAPKTKTPAPKPPKPVLPEFLAEVTTMGYDFQAFMQQFFPGINDLTSMNLSIGQWRNYRISEISGNIIKVKDTYPSPVRPENRFERTDDGYCTTLLHVGADGTVWGAELSLESGGLSYSTNCIIVKNVILKPWKALDRLPAFSITTQSELTVFDILRSVNPYACAFAEENNCDPLQLLAAPWIETLAKAGYAFATDLYSRNTLSRTESDRLNRLCRKGRSPKEIFKTSKSVYTTLKGESDLSVWDCFRRMDKSGRIQQDTVSMVYDMGIGERELEQVNSILGRKHAGKNVFTMESLVSYLRRLDRFEAMEQGEALQTLADYLRLCEQLDMEPRTDGDSLRREHDIAARLSRLQHNDKFSEEMHNGSKEAERYNYTEPVYSVKAITEYDTLLDEARKQHSCVASYAPDIASGKSFIFSMRETAHPDRSLITIELSPDGRTIRQKLLGYNKAIRNRSQSEFIDRWFRYCQDVRP